MSLVWLKRFWLLQFPSEHEVVQLPYGREGHLLFSRRYPSVLLPGSSGVGASCAGSTYKQVADWRSVGEPVIKKKTNLQIALSAFPPPLCRKKYCQHQSEVLTPPSPLPPFCWGKNSFLLQQPAVSVSRCTFLKGGSKLWCPVWSFSSSDFRDLAQLMENTGPLQKMIHPPKIVIIF